MARPRTTKTQVKCEMRTVRGGKIEQIEKLGQRYSYP